MCHGTCHSPVLWVWFVYSHVTVNYIQTQRPARPILGTNLISYPQASSPLDRGKADRDRLGQEHFERGLTVYFFSLLSPLIIKGPRLNIKGSRDHIRHLFHSLFLIKNLVFEMLASPCSPGLDLIMQTGLNLRLLSFLCLLSAGEPANGTMQSDFQQVFKGIKTHLSLRAD